MGRVGNGVRLGGQCAHEDEQFVPDRHYYPYFLAYSAGDGRGQLLGGHSSVGHPLGCLRVLQAEDVLLLVHHRAVGQLRKLAVQLKYLLLSHFRLLYAFALEYDEFILFDWR
jgi:hypothetical protein